MLIRIFYSTCIREIFVSCSSLPQRFTRNKILPVTIFQIFLRQTSLPHQSNIIIDHSRQRFKGQGGLPLIYSFIHPRPLSVVVCCLSDALLDSILMPSMETIFLPFPSTGVNFCLSRPIKIVIDSPSIIIQVRRDFPQVVQMTEIFAKITKKITVCWNIALCRLVDISRDSLLCLS